MTASVATYGIYRYDKGAAENGLGRVPEAVLLGLAAVGGSIGALAGHALSDAPQDGQEVLSGRSSG